MKKIESKKTTKKTDSLITFSCKLNKSLVKRLKKESAERQVNMKDLAAAAIEEYLNKREGR